MSDSIIFSDDIAANATITMTNEDSDYKKENLIDANQSIVTKSDATTTRIVFNFGAAVSILGVAYFNTNFDIATTVLWETGTTSGTTDSSVALDKFVDGFLEGIATKQYMAFDITMPGGEVAQIGKVYILTNNTVLNGDLKNANLVNNFEIIESNSMNNQNGHESREVYNYLDSFSWDYLNMIKSNIFTLNNIAKNNYVCFLPYGDTGVDGDVFYGTYKQGGYRMILSEKVPLSSTDFTSNANFRESPASIDSRY